MRSPVPFVATPMPVVASPVIRDDVALSDIAPATGTRSRRAARSSTHAFLTALHRPGCATPRTGWTPRYLTAWDGHRLARRACRCTRRRTATANTSSTGAGRKPIGATAAATTRSSSCAVPFTPVSGPRILARARAGAPRDARARARARAARHSYSSLHVLFLPEDEAREGEALGMIPRARRAVPLDQRRLPRLRRLPGDVLARQAQEGEAGAAQAARRRRDVRAASAAARSPRPTGRSSTSATSRRTARTTRRPTSRPRSSRRSARTLAEQHDARDRHARRAPAVRRARHLHAGNAVGPLLGHDRVRAGPALRGVLLPGHRVLHRAGHRAASKAARRACTSSRADCVRSPRTRCMRSAIARLRRGDRRFLRARARRGRAFADELASVVSRSSRTLTTASRQGS